MSFTTTIEVRFGDCDPAGIVYFPVLYHYCHVAFEDAWAGALGIDYPTLVGRDRLGFPTVHVETDFVSPARYGDRVEFEVRILRVGTTSVTFEFDARVGERRVLRSTHVKVCVALDTMEKRPIPEHLLSSFARLAA